MTLFKNLSRSFEKSDRLMTELIPFLSYEAVSADDGYFRLKNGEYLDIFQIRCKDLMNILESDLNFDIFTFSKFFKTFGSDIKIIGMNFPVDIVPQKEYLDYKMEKTANTIYRERLQEKRNELKQLAEGCTYREYYLMFFSSSLEDYYNNLNLIQKSLGSHELVISIPAEKKARILFKLNNKNTNLYGSDIDLSIIQKKNEILQEKMEKATLSLEELEVARAETQKKKKGSPPPIAHNPYLLELLQPQGGISFRDEKVVKTGDGYEACIHVYQFPRHVSPLWLMGLVNIDGAVTTLDISTKDKLEVQRNINRSIQEQSLRYVSANAVSEKMDAQSRYEELTGLYHEISSMGEVVKVVHSRIFLSSRTLEELDQNIAGTLNYLESHGYKGAAFLNESKQEWLSIYRSAKQQNKTEYRRYGQPIVAGTLATGHPFHFTALHDPCGTYFGYTLAKGCSGRVMLDYFHKTKIRMSYSGVIVGRMGSGKSTLMKKLIEDRIIRGDFIRGFDVMDEYPPLVERYGGKIVSLDGSQGILNMFEVLLADDGEQKENTSFNIHISKLNAIYSFLSPESTYQERLEFEKMTRTLYVRFGLIPEDFSKHSQIQITGLPANSYPTWSDLLQLIREEKQRLINLEVSIQEKEAMGQRIGRLETIEMTVENIVLNYGSILDGHTSIENISQNQVVFFSIKQLQSLKSEIFNAQFFNAICLCWNNCIQIGGEMKRRWMEKTIAWADITRFLITIDEAHLLVNANRLQAVDQLISFMRQARHYFCGLLFASQSIRDFVPEDSDKEGKAVIKSLFELTQYKFILQQDSNALETLSTIFHDQLTASELSHIPKFEQGDCILAISGDQNVEFHNDVQQKEKDLYHGGA